MSGASLSVVSWNVGRVHLGARAGRLLRWDSRAEDDALGHVARVLGGLDADVIVLQELRPGGGQHERIAAQLGAPWHVAAPREPGGDRHVGLLVRGETGDEAAHAFEALPLGEGRTGQAVVLRRGGRRVAIAGVHFDAFHTRVRARQAAVLGAWLDARDEDAVIVAGDLNVDLALPLYSRLTDRLWWHSLVEARGLDDAGRGAGPTVMLGRRLDYVLLRGVCARDVEVVRGARVPLGDHDPLLVRVDLAAAPRRGDITAPVGAPAADG